MSGIRPSGFSRRCRVIIRLPSTRAPVTVSGSFGMAAEGPGSAGLVRLPGHVRRLPLAQLVQLLLQVVYLALLCYLGGRSLRRGRGRGTGCRLLVVVQLADLGLEDVHRPAERPCGVGQL